MSKTVPFRPDDITELTGSLVGYWKFDGDGTDSSASGYDLTNVGTATFTSNTYWKEGEQSTHLDKTLNQDWEIANSSGLALAYGGNKSVACWFRMTNGAAGNTIMQNQNNVGGGFLIHTYAAKPGDVRVYVNWAQRLLTTGAPIQVGKWNHIACVINQEDSSTTLYINGNIEATATGAKMTSSAHKFAIGDYYTTDGDFKDCAVWNTTLNSLQIKSLALGLDLEGGDAYRPSDVSTAPTHYWTLNETSGNRLENTSVTGSSFTLGESGGTVASTGGYIEAVAADFEAGDTEFLQSDTVDSDFAFGTSDFSISSWFKIETAGTDRRFLSFYKDGSNYWNFGYDNGTGELRFISEGGAGGAITNVDFAWTPVTAVWYHLALVRSSTTWTLYLDGNQLGSQISQSNGVYGDSTTPLIIGKHVSSSYWDGAISDLAIWNGYALTADEVKSLATGLPIQQQGLFTYWQLDEATGADRIDQISAKTLTDSNVVTQTGGVVDEAAYFTRSSSQTLVRAQDTDFDFGSEGFTFMTWYKPKNVGAPSGVFSGFLSKYNATVGWIWTLNAYWSNFSLYGAGGSVSTGNSAFTPKPSDTWQWGALTNDGAKVKFYYESYVVGAAAGYTSAANYNGANYNLRMGAYDANYFDGGFDEFIIAKRWFREEEIKSVYLLGLNGMEATSGGGAGPTPPPGDIDVGVSALTLLGCGWG